METWYISQLRETSQRPLRNISKVMNFLRRLYDIINTTQKDIFHMTSLRCLKHISETMSMV